VTVTVADPERLYTVRATAVMLGVDHQTIRAWITAGQLPSLRVGEKLIRITGEAINSVIH